MNWTKLFTGATLVHEKRSRNRYPSAIIDMLVEKFNFHPFMVGVDLGAGTGRLSALFLNHGYDIIAVEADPKSREKCDQMRDRWPYFRVLAANPGATGLEDASVDFVTVPRAVFSAHQEEVRREIQRILRPGGVVMLITDNRASEGVPQTIEYEELLRAHCPGFREKVRPADIPANVAAFFSPCDAYEETFHDQQALTLDSLINQTKALAICPTPGSSQYDSMVRALRVYFKKWAVDEVLIVPTVCRVALGYMG